MGTLSFHIISIPKLNFKFMKKDADLHTLMRIFRAIKMISKKLVMNAWNKNHPLAICLFN